MDNANDEKKWIEIFEEHGRNFLKKYGRRILAFPTEDGSLLMVGKYYNRLKNYFIFLNDPEEKNILTYFKKDVFFSEINKTRDRMYVPLTISCHNIGDIEEVIDNISLPCVIKPSEKDLRFSFIKKYGSKIMVAKDQKKLKSLLIELIKEKNKIIVQELIDRSSGEEISWWGYRYRDGEMIGITAEMLRRYPNFGGTGTYVKTKNVLIVHQYAKEILKEIDFWGICEIEFMREPSISGYKVVELNPRCWLQLELSNKVGFNFPLIAYEEIYLNKKTYPSNIPRDGKSWIRAEDDFLSKVIYDKRGNMIVRFVNWLRELRNRDTNALYSWKDIWVNVVWLTCLPGKLLNHIRKTTN